MIPSDKLTLPEKSAQRYVFLGRPMQPRCWTRFYWFCQLFEACARHGTPYP